MKTVYLIALCLFGNPIDKRLARAALYNRWAPSRSAAAATGEPADTDTFTFVVAALAASNNFIGEFYFPWPAAVVRYFATPSVAEAAHASQELKVVWVNAGAVDGTGSTVLATITNLSGATAGATLNKLAGGWVAHKGEELCTIARPTLASSSALNIYDKLIALNVVKCTVTKAAGTTTGNVIAGIEYVRTN